MHKKPEAALKRSGCTMRTTVVHQVYRAHKSINIHSRVLGLLSFTDEVRCVSSLSAVPPAAVAADECPLPHRSIMIKGLKGSRSANPIARRSPRSLESEIENHRFIFVACRGRHWGRWDHFCKEIDVSWKWRWALATTNTLFQSPASCSASTMPAAVMQLRARQCSAPLPKVRSIVPSESSRVSRELWPAALPWAVRVHHQRC